ncbi:MAG: TraR/DksA C4-type zinc finger protein [bacterium]|nr:TraR/DksA C4-type zinc finger protein [bacterium]
MSLDLDYFKKQLEEEKTRLEGELGTIAHRNPDAPEDWVVTPPDLNVMRAAKEEVADQEEELENVASVEYNLESRLRDINEALEKMRQGKYGVCAVGGELIDEARLRANPAAITCVKHAK